MRNLIYAAPPNNAWEAAEWNRLAFEAILGRVESSGRLIVNRGVSELSAQLHKLLDTREISLRAKHRSQVP
jgi:hypothetical protein